MLLERVKNSQRSTHMRVRKFKLPRRAQARLVRIDRSLIDTRLPSNIRKSAAPDSAAPN